jgi:AraC family transcriptional regulator
LNDDVATMSLPPDVHACGCPRVLSTSAAAGAYGVRYGLYLPQCRAGLHHHPESRIVLPLDGGFETRQGRHSLALRGGEAVYRPAGQEHVDRYVAPIGCLALLLPADAVLPAPRAAFVVRDAALSGLAHVLLAEMAASDVAGPLVREGLALLAATRVLQRRPLVERGCPRWLDAVRDRLEDDTAAPPTLLALALLVDRDPAHVAETFRRVQGCSVGTSLRRSRLVRARALLDDDPVASLSDVALRCGFADQSHFTRHFRRLFCVTPGAWRRRQRSTQALNPAPSA